jgi:PAS domain-containing protein
VSNDENSGVAADAVSTRRFATVLGELNEGILVEDEHRRIALVNQAFCSIFLIDAPPEQPARRFADAPTGDRCPDPHRCPH